MILVASPGIVVRYCCVFITSKIELVFEKNYISSLIPV